MRLLFDENLSFRLARQLSDLFPQSSQVRLLGLERASDRSIWEFAKANEFVLVRSTLISSKWPPFSARRPKSSD
jgi:predicted nuclease of predicted toxin-antitoxin system